MESSEAASQLVHQLSPYLQESATQIVAASPGLRSVEPSPYEALTYGLTTALLSIGTKHESLGSKVASTLYKYVKGWNELAAPLGADQFDNDDITEYPADGELARVMTLSLSLLGFLDAAAKHVRFWNANERLQLVGWFRNALTEKFLVAVETAQSIVRNARSGQRGLKEWKKISKHYAASGRPIGSMILRQAFMRFVVASATLVVVPHDQTSRTSALDHLQTNPPDQENIHESAENELLEGLAEVAIDEMEFLQNEADYLQRVGSAWQQRLASGLRGSIYTTFLCCAVFNDDIADPDTLLTWLEATLADPHQMNDEDLAAIVFKCLSILAKTSPSVASSLSRSIPRVIVQGGLESRAALGAAEALVSVLKLLPEDTVITTIYTLGNVLSATAVPDKPVLSAPSATANGTAKGRHAGPYQHQHQATGSAISLQPSDSDEPTHLSATVIRTIVGIVRSCEDEKVTALALSMLVQKIGRVGLLVDAMIVTETGMLAPYASATELKSLLKLYAKLGHDALVTDNVILLEAVGHFVACVVGVGLLTQN